jgi:AcrR family transcriptional regulator
MKNKKLASDERRQQILENAARLFAVYGLNGTSMRDVARACEVNEALIYKHFESKKDLYREVVSGVQAQIDNHWRAMAEEARDGREALRSVLKALLFGPISELHTYSYLVHGVAAASRDPRIKELVGDGFNRLHVFLRDLVKRGKEDGSLKDGADPDKCGWCILSRGLACSIVSGVVPESCLLPSREEFLPDMLLQCVTPGRG